MSTIPMSSNFKIICFKRKPIFNGLVFQPGLFASYLYLCISGHTLVTYDKRLQDHAVATISKTLYDKTIKTNNNGVWLGKLIFFM